MSDIEKHDEEMNPEDGMVAGLTLWLRTLFEDWAQSFKQEVFEAVKDAVKESDIISDIEHRLDEAVKNAKAIHDEAVTHKELQEKLDEATNDVRIAAIEANIEELTETVSDEVTKDVLAKQEKLEKFFEMASQFFA